MFLRMPSYYLCWHLAQRLAPMLFTDDDKADAEAARTSPVAPAHIQQPHNTTKPQVNRYPGRPPRGNFGLEDPAVGQSCASGASSCRTASKDVALPAHKVIAARPVR